MFGFLHRAQANLAVGVLLMIVSRDQRALGARSRMGEDVDAELDQVRPLLDAVGVLLDRLESGATR